VKEHLQMAMVFVGAIFATGCHVELEPAGGGLSGA